jgi:hypothetical protein
MPPELSRTITDTFVAVLTVTIPIIGGFTVTWLKTHTSQKQLDIATEIAERATKAVEQIYGGLSPDERANADTKLQAAQTRARELAARMGITLSDDQLRTLIEQAVREMKRDFAAPPPAPIALAVREPLVPAV